MKATFLSIVLMSLLVLGSHEVKAQMYEPYAYAPYGNGVQYQPYPYPQQYDPYYECMRSTTSYICRNTNLINYIQRAAFQGVL